MTGSKILCFLLSAQHRARQDRKDLRENRDQPVLPVQPALQVPPELSAHKALPAPRDLRERPEL